MSHNNLAHPSGNVPFQQVAGVRVAAVSLQQGDEPKYLIRNSDGKVYPYNAFMAADTANFTPSNMLPAQHVAEINQAREREAIEAAAIRQAQIAQDAQKRLVEIQYEKLLQEYMEEQENAQKTVAPSLEEQLRIDEAVIAQRDLAGLAAYAKSEFNVTVKGGIEQVRGQVRFLQKKRREIICTPEATTPPPGTIVAALGPDSPPLKPVEVSAPAPTEHAPIVGALPQTAAADDED